MIVIDAAILANAVGDDFADGVTARDVLRQETIVAAPDLVNVEAAAVLRKRWIAGELTTSRLNRAVEAIGNLPLAVYPTSGLIRRAVELRQNITIYDGTYVALAEALSAELVTADRKLAGAPGPTCSIRLVT